MFGQGSLGVAALGQPEEFPAVTPIPAVANVTFTVEPEATVTIQTSTQTVEETEG